MSNKKRRSSICKPSGFYSECPVCRSQSLIRLEVDVLCGDCDWDSTSTFVDSGGMDDIYAAFQEHFQLQRSTEQIQAEAMLPRLDQSTASLNELQNTEEFFIAEESA